MKKWQIVLLSIILVLAVGFVAWNVVKAFQDGDYQHNYQLFLAIGVVAVAVIAFAFALISKDKSPMTTRAIAYAAVCLALSFALSYVRIFRMPQGGSVTLASVTMLILFSYYFGTSKGLLCCFIYGILQAIQDPWVVHPVQFLLDYPLAYLMLGFVGIFKPLIKNPKISLICGICVCVLMRYLCHFVAGCVFFADYAPEGVAVWIYSATYQTTVLVDGAIAGVLAVVATSSRPVHTMLSNASQVNG